MTIERFVAFILAPFLTAGSAWLCGAVAKYGVHLDKPQVNVLMIAGALSAASAVWKWLHGRSASEALAVQASIAGVPVAPITHVASVLSATPIVSDAVEFATPPPDIPASATTPDGAPGDASAPVPIPAPATPAAASPVSPTSSTGTSA